MADNTTATLAMYPNDGTVGTRGDSEDSLFLRMKAFKFTPSTVASRSISIGDKPTDVGAGSGSIKEKSGSMAFLLDDNFSYSLAHTWDDNEDTIASKLKDMGVTIQKNIAGLTDIASFLPTFGASLSVKNDHPLLYVNSERRQYSFTFQLFNTSNPESGVMSPIKQLEEWSMPSTGGYTSNYNVSFEYPYVVEIKTCKGKGMSPVALVNDVCAITSVMPTYYAPYIRGYPCKATVDIALTSIYPTYKDRQGRAAVNVTTKGTGG